MSDDPKLDRSAAWAVVVNNLIEWCGIIGLCLLLGWCAGWIP